MNSHRDLSLESTWREQRDRTIKASAIVAALCALTLAGCGSEETASQTAAADQIPTATYGGGTRAAAEKPVPQQPTSSSATPRPAAGIAPRPTGSETLSYPEDLQMIMLAYRLRGETPPFEKWAKDAQAVRMANEFTRAQAMSDEMQRLRDSYDDTANAGFLQLRTSSQFSEYDGNQGGYYLAAFAPGTTYEFRAQGEKTTLQITNASAAYFWPLEAQAAQEVLQKNSNTRHVYINATLALTGVERRSTGPVLIANVLEYSILGGNYAREAVLDRRSVVQE